MYASKHLFATFIFFSLFINGNAQKVNSHNKIADLPQKEIRDLSYAIKAAATYKEDFRRKTAEIVDSLNLATDNEAKCRLCFHLFADFRAVNTDSAAFYAYKAKSLAQDLDLETMHRANIAVTSALATSGLFAEAEKQFNALSQLKLDRENQTRLWLTGRRLYGYMKSYAQGNREIYDQYDRLNIHYDSLLIENLQPGDSFRDFIICERLVQEGKYNEARAKLSVLLEKVPLESNVYAMAAYQLAEVYQNLNDEYNYAAMLASSALSDVKGCRTEGIALPTLAYFLYKKGKFAEAYVFINFALEGATEGNARMRAVEIARFLPLIDDAYQRRINSQRDELMIYFLVAVFLLFITIVLMIVLNKQIKKSKANAHKLAVTTKRQDSYIGNFMGLYSGYAERLNRLTKLVSTKIAAGQITELKKLVESGKYADQENDNIHKIFDGAFLDIYPDFVDKVNLLLRPEERITLKTPRQLTPELRIYAFVKLGIDESTRIAQTLQYSLNTVYTYRNKIRNKAIKRESFDADVAKLD